MIRFSKVSQRDNASTGFTEEEKAEEEEENYIRFLGVCSSPGFFFILFNLENDYQKSLIYLFLFSSLLSLCVKKIFSSQTLTDDTDRYTDTKTMKKYCDKKNCSRQMQTTKKQISLRIRIV